MGAILYCIIRDMTFPTTLKSAMSHHITTQIVRLSFFDTFTSRPRRKSCDILSCSHASMINGKSNFAVKSEYFYDPETSLFLRSFSTSTSLYFLPFMETHKVSLIDFIDFWHKGIFFLQQAVQYLQLTGIVTNQLIFHGRSVAAFFHNRINLPGVSCKLCLAC